MIFRKKLYLCLIILVILMIISVPLGLVNDDSLLRSDKWCSPHYSSSNLRVISKDKLKQLLETTSDSDKLLDYYYICQKQKYYKLAKRFLRKSIDQGNSISPFIYADYVLYNRVEDQIDDSIKESLDLYNLSKTRGYKFWPSYRIGYIYTNLEINSSKPSIGESLEQIITGQNAYNQALKELDEIDNIENKNQLRQNIIEELDIIRITIENMNKTQYGSLEIELYDDQFGIVSRDETREVLTELSQQVENRSVAYPVAPIAQQIDQADIVYDDPDVPDDPEFQFPDFDPFEIMYTDNVRFTPLGILQTPSRNEKRLFMSDMHNVHDTGITKSMIDIVDKLKIKTKGKSKSGIYEIKNSIRSLTDIDTKKKEDALRTLDMITNKATYIGSLGMNEKEVLGLVWSRIQHPDNVKRKTDLARILTSQLADCYIGSCDNVWCPTGRVSRIIGTLDQADADETLTSLRPQWMIKEEIVDKFIKVREEEIEKMSTNELEKYESGESVDQLRSKVKDRMTDEYKNLVEPNTFNEILNPYLAEV